MRNANIKNRQTEVKSEVVFLGRLLELVTSGRMLVPRFQRPYVWRHRDMLSLLESVFLGYPIGSVLVWETDANMSAMSEVGPIPVKRREGGNVSYILDGHQRIATLAGTIMLDDSHDPMSLGVDWRIYFDLENGEFLHEPKKSGVQPHHFPMRSLLSTPGFLAACRQLEEQVNDGKRVDKLLKAADQLSNAFKNFQLPLISVSEASMENAVTVFARLNQRGRVMEPDQMVSALTYKEGGFHLAEHLDSFQEDLGRRGFGKLDRIFLLRAVLAAMNKDIYAKDFLDLLAKPEVQQELPTAIVDTKDSVGKALDFLNKLGVVSDRVLPYGLQLVLLAEFFRLCPSPTETQEAILSRWFWVTSFTGWFGGVNTAQARAALTEMRRFARQECDTFCEVNLDEAALPFPKRFDGRSARVRGFLVYLASLNPQSFDDTQELDAGALLSESGTNALGYIFSAGLSDELRSSPANRIFVPKGHRGQAIGILADAAKKLDQNKQTTFLSSHGFSSDFNQLISIPNNRNEIVESRLKSLVAGERSFLQQREVILPTKEIDDTIRDSDVSSDD